MNKYAKRFLVASLVTLTGLANAATTTNKTHLQPRPAGVNLAMEKTIWHTQINKKITKEDDKFGASLQAVGFYEQSTNGAGLGKYFGFGNRNELTVGLASTSVAGRVDRRHLIHRGFNSGENVLPVLGQINGSLAGNLKLKFEHRQGGVRFDYFQDLDGVLKGLYFHLNAPIVWSQTRSEIGLSSSTTQSIYNTGYPSKSVSDYFSGNITQTTSPCTQTSLNYARIDGNKSKTSLADIDFKLGWNFWETLKHHAGINVGVTFPTSPDAKGVHLFEPLGGGNGQHWGLGAGLDLKVQPWTDEEQNIELQLVVNYRYLFEGKDTRTLGFQSSTGTLYDWGQYFLVGQTGVAGVQPLANISTGKVNVKAGSQVDLLAGFSYNNGGFTLDLGYELYAREAEKVTRKFDLPATGASDVYLLSANDYIPDIAGTTNTFLATDSPTTQPTIGSTQAHGTGIEVLNANLATSVAESPCQVTNKIYGALGYSWNDWETPLMLGLGGEFEFASSQKALQQWGVFGKIGISF